MRTVYVFDKRTGNFLWSQTIPDRIYDHAGNCTWDGLNDDMTETAPPQEMAGYSIVWDGTGWSYKQDEPKVEPASVTQPAEDATQREIDELQAYLDETDYKVIKCLELGLDIDKEYPGVRTSRQNARVRIRALRDNANR